MKDNFMKTHRLDIRKIEASDAALNYRLQSFFDKTTIVPSIHLGEPSRPARKTDTSPSSNATQTRS